MDLDPAFAPALARFDLAAFDREASTIYAVDRDLTLTFLNRSWWTFAEKNGAHWAKGEWGLGASLLAATPKVLLPFYRTLFTRALDEGDPVDHRYECSSPRIRRRYIMRLYPLAREGFLVTNALVAREPWEAPSLASRRYASKRGTIVMCSHCRRTRRHEAGVEQWDWVPAYAKNPPATTSHGLCAACLDYHYPEEGAVAR